ncbi:MAG: spermidine/putrescine ABC transporter substrate-binding protein [Anaerolineales bacterium]
MNRSGKLVIIILISLFAVGCAATGDGDGDGGGDGDTQQILNLYNWSEYVDPELLVKFEEETGIKVVEDTFGSNEDLLGKLQGGATGYDVIVPSDYMVDTMIELGFLAKLDKSQLTTLGDLDPTWTDPPFDPGLEYCLPYFWGTTGIGFNWNDWDEAPGSWAYLFDPELAAEFDGRISFLDDMRETIGAALIYLGYSINTTNEAELQEAKEVILAVKPYLASFDSDNFEDTLLTGDTALVMGWSGDIFTAQLEDENIDYIIPEEGAAKWMDNLCITADAGADPDRFANSLLFLDFMNRPDIAAQNTNWVWYASPNKSAESMINPEILEYPAIYPSPETFEKLEWFENLGEATELYDRIWTEISTE